MMKAVLLCSLLTLTSASTALAETVFMTARGSRQGDIQGGVTQRGREGSMQCTGFTSAIASPRDAASGLATGRRQIEPIRCTKRIDRASPQLLSALLTNEVLTNVTFRFLQRAPNGAETVAYTVALTNASVASVRQFLDPDGLAQEEVSLAYQQGTVTFEQGGVTAEIPRQP
jgi:type VI secretion system secreted protein Hcp